MSLAGVNLTAAVKKCQDISDEEVKSVSRIAVPHLVSAHVFYRSVSGTSSRLVPVCVWYSGTAFGISPRLVLVRVRYSGTVFGISLCLILDKERVIFVEFKRFFWAIH